MPNKLSSRVSKEKPLVVVADDFGLTTQINHGIFKTYKDGIVTELSLQLGSHATDHALDLIKNHNIKNVGIHLLLYSSQKIHKVMHRADYLAMFQEKSSVELERLAELEFAEFVRLVGRQPTHIIPQFGIHGNLKVLDSIISFAKRNHIPMRIPRTALIGDLQDENYAAEIMMKRAGIKSTDHLFGYVSGSDSLKIKNDFLFDLGQVKPGETTELLFHPGFVDQELFALSSLRYERGRDLALCLDDDFRQEINKLGFRLMSYSQI